MKMPPNSTVKAAVWSKQLETVGTATEKVAKVNFM